MRSRLSPCQNYKSILENRAFSCVFWPFDHKAFYITENGASTANIVHPRMRPAHTSG